MPVNFGLKAGFQQTNKYKQFLFSRNIQSAKADYKSFHKPVSYQQEETDKNQTIQQILKEQA